MSDFDDEEGVDEPIVDDDEEPDDEEEEQVWIMFIFYHFNFENWLNSWNVFTWELTQVVIFAENCIEPIDRRSVRRMFVIVV